jgi:hypothetical protein
MMSEGHHMGINGLQFPKRCSGAPQQCETHIKGQFLGNKNPAHLLDNQIDRLRDGSSGGVLDRHHPQQRLSGTDSMKHLGDCGHRKSRTFWKTSKRHKVGKSTFGSKVGNLAGRGGLGDWGRRHVDKIYGDGLSSMQV